MSGADRSELYHLTNMYMCVNFFRYRQRAFNFQQWYKKNNDLHLLHVLSFGWHEWTSNILNWQLSLSACNQLITSRDNLGIIVNRIEGQSTSDVVKMSWAIIIVPSHHIVWICWDLDIQVFQYKKSLFWHYLLKWR